MDPPAITTQPMRSSEKPTEVNAEIISNGDTYTKEITENGVKENLPEFTAVFDDAAHMEEMAEEEKEKRRREEVSDCCCVYTPYYAGNDPFCFYILCHWICNCFRGIGHCTESCFEGCANCLSECCEGDACCTCDDGGDGGCGCGDCLSGCADCCSGCDCDCSS